MWTTVNDMVFLLPLFLEKSGAKNRATLSPFLSEFFSLQKMLKIGGSPRKLGASQFF